MSKRTNNVAGFIILWDDESGLMVPMGADDDCAGAVQGFTDVVAIFPTRQAAQKALRISAAHAKLRQEQGAPANDDFIGKARKCLRIVPLKTLG